MSLTSGAVSRPAAGSVAACACVAKRLLQELEPAVELLVRDHERDEDAYDVAVQAAGEEDEPALPRRLRGGLGERRGRPLRLPILDELDRAHGAEAAHFADGLHPAGDGLERRANPPAHLVGPRAELIRRDLVEDGQRGRARNRGLVLLSCGLYGNVIRILVPLSISDEALERGLDLLEESLGDAGAA